MDTIKITPEVRWAYAWHELRDLIADLAGHVPPEAGLVDEIAVSALLADAQLIRDAVWRLADTVDLDAARS